ncbi:MAG TPA: DUF3375 family protein [Tepidisphaeraceae bacterium]|jgi:hypothetical protein|nr:DUF3375 family protein [Tepidisphaeraceae bacterium]
MNSEACQRLIKLRGNHPAWLLLASRNGPLILAGLQSLIDALPNGIDFEGAVEHLRGLFAENANDENFDVGDDHAVAARRELRQWLKRGLIVEREGQLLATDALQRSFRFLDSLQDQPMTSTASRLATVQREIENLEAQLSHSQRDRENSLKQRIAAMQEELAAVQSGDFEVLSGAKAVEGIREVYQLAVSLRADFRRVEDSYRDADRALRQRVVSEKRHRGEIVDELLNGHEALIKTGEGQVFEGFYQQLVKSVELEQMKQRLRLILENENTDTALERTQKADLRLLVPRLVHESQRVIQARARSERDVRGFLKSGLADEEIRVGAILLDLFQAALRVDWQPEVVRQTLGPLPPIALAVSNLPLVERLLFKDVSDDDAVDLDLTLTEADPAQMDEEFWRAYRALDRKQLFDATINQLQESGGPLTIRILAAALPPNHDLETLAYWLAMAREAGIEVEDEDEVINLFNQDEGWTRFYVPTVKLTFAAVNKLAPGSLE